MARTANSSNAANQAIGMVNVVLDQEYDPPLIGLLVPVKGDIEVVAIDGSQTVVPEFSGYLSVFVRKVVSAGTTASTVIGLVG